MAMPASAAGPSTSGRVGGRGWSGLVPARSGAVAVGGGTGAGRSVGWRAGEQAPSAKRVTKSRDESLIWILRPVVAWPLGPGPVVGRGLVCGNKDVGATAAGQVWVRLRPVGGCRGGLGGGRARRGEWVARWRGGEVARWRGGEVARSAATVNCTQIALPADPWSICLLYAGKLHTDRISG